MSTQLDLIPLRLRGDFARAIEGARSTPPRPMHGGYPTCPRGQARPSVRGQVQLELFTTDGDVADAMAAVEPYLPRDAGIGHDEQ
jgi:hypothetical protein